MNNIATEGSVLSDLANKSGVAFRIREDDTLEDLQKSIDSAREVVILQVLNSGKGAITSKDIVLELEGDVLAMYWKKNKNGSQ